MQESYKFQVNCRGSDGIVFDISPDKTILHMMSLICDEWLDNFRNGDGTVYDHLWKFMRYNDYDEYDSEAEGETYDTVPHQWTQEQAMAYEYYLMARNSFPESLPINVSLKQFQWWTVGTSVTVNYDYGRTTEFEGQGKHCLGHCTIPIITPNAADTKAETFVPFVPTKIYVRAFKHSRVKDSSSYKSIKR